MSNRGSIQTEINVPATLSLSANDVPSSSRRQRPLSFSGGDVDVYNDNTLKMITTPGERSSASLIAETLQQIDQLGVELDSYCMNLTNQDSSSGVGSSVISDQNGSSNHLESSLITTPVVTPPTYRNLPPSLQTSSSSIGSCGRNRPPPPERRNSTIQTASTFAPSIADLRISNGEYSNVQFRDAVPRYTGSSMSHQQSHNYSTHAFK